jgi:hypothetical protein
VALIGKVLTGKAPKPSVPKVASEPFLLDVALGLGIGGGCLLLLLVCGLVFWYRRHRRRRAAAASQGGTASALQRPLAAYADRGSSAGGTGSASSSEGGSPSYQAPGQIGGRTPGWSPLGPQQPPSSGVGGRGQAFGFQPMSAPNSPPVSGGGRAEYHEPHESPSAPPFEQQPQYAGIKAPANYGDSAYGLQQQQRAPAYPLVPPPLQQQQPASGRSSPALHPGGSYSRGRPSSPLGMPSRAGGAGDSVPMSGNGQVAAGFTSHQRKAGR